MALRKGKNVQEETTESCWRLKRVFTIYGEEGNEIDIDLHTDCITFRIHPSNTQGEDDVMDETVITLNGEENVKGFINMIYHEFHGES